MHEGLYRLGIREVLLTRALLTRLARFLISYLTALRFLNISIRQVCSETRIILEKWHLDHFGNRVKIFLMNSYCLLSR